MIKTCGVYVIAGGRILTCHPTNQRDSIRSIPKGAPNSGEDHLTAAKRELLEETGIDIQNFDCSIDYMGDWKYRNKDKVLYGWCANVNGLKILDERLHCSSMTSMGFPEIDKFEWISMSDISRIQEEQYLLFTAFMRKVYKGWRW